MAQKAAADFLRMNEYQPVGVSAGDWMARYNAAWRGMSEAERFDAWQEMRRREEAQQQAGPDDTEGGLRRAAARAK
jgi:hypothetical protein